MVNYYSQKSMDHIIKDLENGGSDLKDIPIEVFRAAVMRQFGMTARTANKWLENFIQADLITIKNVGKGKELDWRVNFKNGSD